MTALNNMDWTWPYPDSGVDTVNGRSRAYCLRHEWFGPKRRSRWDAVGDGIEHVDEEDHS